MMQLDFSKLGGLVPAVAQDARSGVVLMVGFMNEAALAATLETGRVTFFSRSRGKLWVKGETSGNFLAVESWEKDCDEDSLLFRVTPAGPTCHTGATACFPDRLAFLGELEDVIAQRIAGGGEGSYVARLVGAGVKRVAQKVGEEGVETALALTAGDEREVVSEAADLLFHLMVGLKARGLGIGDVVGELAGRHSSVTDG